LVSDGVYDNLDPQQLGKTPKELNLKLNDWKELDNLQKEPIYEEAEKIKESFVLKFLSFFLGGEQDPSPETVGQKLIDHCVRITKNSRDWMENNYGKKLPSDYQKYPGNVANSSSVTDN
jgi:hypothetical protein